MKTLTAVIIDDERLACERLERLLRSFKKVNLLKSFTSSGRAIDFIIRLKPDMIFLDVELGSEVSAFDVIRNIKDRLIQTHIILVTAFPQYSIKAIKSDVFDYLLKPVDIDELKQTIERLQNRFSFKASGKLTQFTMLSSRELEILKYILNGERSNKIAEELYISKNTVNTHRRNILKKTGKKSFLELIRYAQES